MKKLALVCALTLVPTLSFAGEVKGPPGPDGATGGDTPNAGFFEGEGTARSVCSTSGLNDERTPGENTQTQSYGTFLVYFAGVFNVSVGDFKKNGFLPSPGNYQGENYFGGCKPVDN